MSPCNCPKCGALMEYVDADPDVGIEGHAYVCTDDSCGEVVECDDDDYAE